ncbi:MAG: hypothetical protein AAGG48_20965 [Planctomycetota bacterium]
MLIESIPSNKPPEQPNDDGEKVQAWQSELDDFLAKTMTRLDSLAEALSEAIDETHTQSALGVEVSLNNRTEFPTQPTVDTNGDQVSEFRDVPTNETALADSVPGDANEVTHVQDAAADSFDASANADSNLLESPSGDNEIPGATTDTAQPDEAWERLNAIKSRLAKQLENQ